MTLWKVPALALALLTSLFIAGAQLTSDHLVGTWELNLKESRYRPGPAPRSQTRVYREDAKGIWAVVTTVTADGHTVKAEFPENYDGQVHPVEGSLDYDGIKMTQLNNYYSESELMHAGRVLVKATRLVSEDGNKLTITFDSVASEEYPVHNVVVYDRKK